MPDLAHKYHIWVDFLDYCNSHGKHAENEVSDCFDYNSGIIVQMLSGNNWMGMCVLNRWHCRSKLRRNWTNMSALKLSESNKSCVLKI